MTDVTLILAAAALAFTLSRWWKVPAVPLLILGGFLLAVIPRAPEGELLQEVLLLGLAFLVFSAGTELDPQRVGRYLTASIVTGLVQFTALGGSALALALLLDFPWITAVYLGLGAAASSTLVVVRILQGNEQFFEPFGRLVLGVLLVQDVLVIFFISILSHSGAGISEIVLATGKVLILLSFAAAFRRWTTPYLLIKFALDEETLLLILLAVLFLFVGFSQVLGLPLVVGAFLAGFSLSGFPVNGLIRGQLLSLSNFFLAVFFVSLGASLRLPAGSDFFLALLFASLVLILTPPMVTFLAELSGLSARAGLEAGLLLSQTSEFSIVLALVGLQQKHVDERVLAIMTLVTVVSMMWTPFLATHRNTWRLMKFHPSRWQRTEPMAASDHILVLGCGETGRLLLDRLRTSGRQIVVVDDDPAVVNQLRSAGWEAIRGDGADFRILRATGALKARIVVSTMRRLRDHLAVLKVVKDGKVICRIFEEEEAEQIRRRGGIPVLYSHAAADEFLRWFGSEFGRSRISAGSGDGQ